MFPAGMEQNFTDETKIFEDFSNKIAGLKGKKRKSGGCGPTFRPANQ